MNFFRSRPQQSAPLREQQGINFGDETIPDSESTSHFMGVAATGGGKTTLLRKMLQSVLPGMQSGSDRRALLYDAKQDLMPLLASICPQVECLTLHPFDERGVAWDMYRDVREPRVIIETAFTLIPWSPESTPFFADAARHLTYGVMQSFALSGYEWTFGDLLRGLKSAKRLKCILKKHVSTRDLVSQYFYDKRLLSNILSTIATKMLAFEPIAAAWESAQRKVSLDDWSKSEQVLVLGNSEISRAAIDAVNRAIFKRAVDTLLQQSESRTRRTWFVVDELADAGRLDGLVALLKKSRSKGGCVAIFFQSIAGLRDQRMYGTHLTDEILGQIGNRFFGRLECPETAEWASKLHGDQEGESVSRSVTKSKDGTSTTETRQTSTRRAVLPVEFMIVPPCTRENGLTAHFLTRTGGAYRTTLNGPQLFDKDLIPPAAKVPDFIPRPFDSQLLQPWTEEQQRKFGIELKPKPASKPSRERPPRRNVSLLEDLSDLDS
jgi:type IV secretory pathway TraG/TraD family ATPase VirD4